MSDPRPTHEQTTTPESADHAPTNPFVPPTPVTPLPSASILSSFTTPQQVANRFAKIDARIAKLQDSKSEIAKLQDFKSEKEIVESKDLPTIDESHGEQSYEHHDDFDNDASENHHSHDIEEIRRHFDYQMIQAQNEKQALQQALFETNQRLAQAQYEQSFFRYHPSSNSQSTYVVSKSISKPDPFNGDFKSDADTWIATMRNYLALTNTPVNIQSQVAGTYLKQAAAQWYNTLPVSERSTLVDFETLARMLLVRFRPLDIVGQARRKLAGLTQTGAVDGFNQAFMALMQLLPTMNEEEKIECYRSKLKFELKKQLVTQEYHRLSDIMNVSLRTDALLFEHNLVGAGQRQNQFKNRPFAPRYRNEQGTPSPTTVAVNNVKVDQQEQHREYESQSADQQVSLNYVAAAPRPMDEAERQRCRDNRLCFRCRQPGHRSSNCTVFTSSNQRPGLKPSTDISSKKY